MIDKKYYTIPEAAKIIGVSEQTIRNYIKKGVIESVQFVKGSKHRIYNLDIPSYTRTKKTD